MHNNWDILCTCTCRATPVETLHTILLGPYKYLLKDVMSHLTKVQKSEVLARMASFNYSGIDGKVLGNVVSNHKSFVGRDYKAWAPIALFIISPYLSDSDKEVWIQLSKVLGDQRHQHSHVLLLCYFVSFSGFPCSLLSPIQ